MWARKRLVVDQIWEITHARPNIRTLPQCHKYRNIDIKLLPGGCWVLVLCQDGSVWYYDLDSDEPEQLPLIPPPMTSKLKPYAGLLAVFVDYNVSRVEFKLALYRNGECADHRRDFC